MRRKLAPVLITLAAVVATVVAGCSGGGGALAPGGHNGDSAGTGSIAVHIGPSGVSVPSRQAPTSSSTIPSATTRFRIRITDPNNGSDLLAPVLIPRPTTPGLVTRTIDGVPVGIVTLIVDALDDNGQILAEAIIQVDVVEGQNASVSVQPSPLGSGTTTTTSSVNNFAVVTNDGDNTIGVYQVTSTNALKEVTAGSRPATGTNPHGATVVAGAANPFLYVANSGSSDISAFKLDTVKGLPSAGANFAAPGTATPEWTATDGQNLFVTDNSTDKLLSFQIAAGGGLSPGSSTGASQASPPVSVSNLAGLVSFPSISTGFPLVYVAGSTSGNIARFFVDQANGGRPSGTSRVVANTVSNNPLRFAAFQASSGGTAVTYLYVVAPSAPSPFGGQVYGYKVDTASGALTDVPGSPVDYGTQNGTQAGIAVCQGHLYVTSPHDNKIFMFGLSAADGSMSSPTPFTPDVFSDTPIPVDLAASADQQFLFVVNQGDAPHGLGMFGVNGVTGSITPLTSAATGNTPYHVTTYGISSATSGGTVITGIGSSPSR